jgi:hypothetical protein
MNRRQIGKHSRLKHGSYWCKHRGHVSRWLDNVVANLRRRKRPKSRMYDSVAEAFGRRA